MADVTLEPGIRRLLIAHYPLERFGRCECGQHIMNPRGGTFNHGEFEAEWAKHVAALGSPVASPPEPSEAAIEAALNVTPERAFVPVAPYGGVMQPVVSRDEMRVILRAASAAEPQTERGYVGTVYDDPEGS